ncbi:ribonucleases P/MRP protein subunit POP1-domain-containing protein [Obelidium mucronatum]|nr:ribonucleases P/MRP protein subunit POP1-domain-containing protein [Obelidium mucronatum]
MEKGGKKRPAPDSGAGNSGTPKKEFLNAKQRRVAKQVMDVQPVKNPDGPARIVKVEEFVEARQYEIKAMESALTNATEFTGNMRVFQTLPRHMRRRAASYNVKRLPQKYRQRAIDQMSNGKEKPQPIKMSRRAKRRPGAIFEMFQKRSKEDKRWLDTHLWHAKRMHMGQKWGFVLGLHPNGKSTRASFRASQHAAIVHDASYYVCLEVKGSESSISTVMGLIVDPTCISVGAKRFLAGDRQGSTFIHKLGEFPNGAVAPASFFWIAGCPETERILWLWVHPSASSEVLQVVQSAVNACKLSVSVKSRKSELSRFELTGPRSHAILQEVLKINENCSLSTDAHKTWSLLDSLRTPAALPAGVVMGLSIHDPRLTFPPKMKPRATSLPSQHVQSELHKILVQWPKSLANTTLHLEESRAAYLHMSPSEHELNKKRSETLVPGSRLPANAGGPPVPILLVQRNTPGSTDKSGEFVNGWDVIVPAGTAAVCLWKSFVFAGAHAIGLNDRRRICFETGVASFPEDYPETLAHVSWAKEERDSKSAEWSRKPPAKRVNYEKLGVVDPFVSNYARIVGGAVDGEPSQVQVIHGTKLVGVVKQGVSAGLSLDDMARSCVEAIKSVRPGFSIAGDFSLEKSFVRCRLTMVGRGMADEHGIIYQASAEQIGFWTEFLKDTKEREVDDFDWLKPPLDSSDEAMEAVLDRFPAKEQIIGYVGFGGFSMADGNGSALGCCLLKGLVETKALANDKGKYFVLVRGPRGRVCRPAHFEILH